MLQIIVLLSLLTIRCFGFRGLPSLLPHSDFISRVSVQQSSSVHNSKLFFHSSFAVAEEVDLDALQRAIAGTDYGLDSNEVFIAKWIAIAVLSSILFNRFKPLGSCRDELIEVQQSFYLPGELGVVSKQLIPRGTVIGTYPGYLKTQRVMVDSKLSEEAVERARKYQWSVLDNQYVIDPTNPSGALPKELNYCFGLYKVGTSLACINEPPPGLDVNVYVRVEGSKVEFIAERDIRPSEELFVDYGPYYDRSDYRKDKRAPPPPDDVIAKQTPTLEPIFNDGRPRNNRNSNDKRQDDGILSPSDALDLFSVGGASGLFADGKDREIVDSILGRGNSQQKDKGELGAEALMELMRRAVTDDDDKANQSNSKGNNSPTRGKGFGNIISTEMVQELKAELDSLSDEELEMVYEQVRLQLANERKRDEPLLIEKQNKLPRVKPKNAEIAAKYAGELQQIEEMLEDMYSNPLGTLRDMSMNPQKYGLTVDNVRDIIDVSGNGSNSSERKIIDIGSEEKRSKDAEDFAR